MRQIKFRAWHEDKGMIDDPPTVLVESASLNSNLETYEELDYVLMQYTGIKDKNGVEIYEGDIIAYDERDNIAKVEYIAAGFYLNFKQNIRQLVFDARIEVIGNTYEKETP